MSYQGIDLTEEAGQESTTISWHLPHAFFIIILVGPQEEPFGIQKDLLLAQSPYFREYFSRDGSEEQIEQIIRLPHTTVEIFGCFQNFIFSGKVYDRDGGIEVPEYKLLLGVWKLACKLKMAPLRMAVMDAMSERRTQTSTIPSAEFLIQAWEETDEGSGLRLMLVEWAAEHMRSAVEARTEFARALPQQILSELVITMSGLPIAPPSQAVAVKRQRMQDEVPQKQGSVPIKRPRISTANVPVTEEEEEAKSKLIINKKGPRKSNGRRSTRFEILDSDPAREMAFCTELINKMLSAPGFWTRLVAPFKNPVDPARDNVPNYFAVIKRPICLRDIQTRMHRGEYTTPAEFEKDVRQIFLNCYEYWTQDDPIFKLCEQFEKTFHERFALMDRWRGQTIKAEIIED